MAAAMMISSQVWIRMIILLIDSDTNFASAKYRRADDILLTRLTPIIWKKSLFLMSTVSFRNLSQIEYYYLQLYKNHLISIFYLKISSLLHIIQENSESRTKLKKIILRRNE